MGRHSCALALLGTLAVARAAERDCAALGFTQALRCSSCAKLEALVHDDELHGDCLACCAEDAAGQALLAVRARLEVCQWKLGHYPSVREFIEGSAEAFGERLEVKYRQGQKPQLVMLNAADERAETVSLTTWDVDTIKEYLNENLAKEDGAASAQAA